MSVLQLAENLPIIQNALVVQADLPRPLQGALSSAMFACAAILALSDDLEECANELQELDLSQRVGLEIDPDCLEMITEAAAELASQLGSYLPVHKIIEQLKSNGILKEDGPGFSAMGQSSLLIHFFGNEFLLLDGQLLVDTPRGRIHKVLEVDYTKQRAVFEICTGTLDGIPSYQIFAYDHGQLRENVGALTPTSFKFLAYNEDGSRLGIFQFRERDYLFQDGCNTNVKFEGEIVSAEFISAAKAPTGIVRTSKFVYLIKDGQEFDKIELAKFSAPEDIQIKCELIDPATSDQVIFWGTLEYPNGKSPYIFKEISCFTVDDIDHLCPVVGEMRRHKEQVYFVTEFGKSSEQKALVAACMDSTGEVRINLTLANDGGRFTDIEFLPGFDEIGEAVIHFEESSLYALNNGHFYSFGEGLEIIADLPVLQLVGSETIYSKLLATYQSWTLYGPEAGPFPLPPITFDSNTDPIQVHHTKGKLPTVFGIGKDGERHFFLEGIHINLTDPQNFLALEGVFGQDDRTSCLFRTTAGYLCFAISIRDGDIKLVESYLMSNPEVHPWGIVGNSQKDGKTGMVLNGLFFPEYIFRQAATILDQSGARTPLVETNNGCFLFNVVTLTLESHPEFVFHSSPCPGELIIAKKSAYSPERLDMGINFPVDDLSGLYSPSKK